MAKKGRLKNRFWVPKKLCEALAEAAKEKSMTLKEYMDELSVYLLLGEFE